MAIPVSSAISAAAVMTCTAVCTAVRRTNWMHSKRLHVVDRQHGILAAKPDVVQCPARAFLGGPLQHGLEVVIGEAQGRVVARWGHDDHPFRIRWPRWRLPSSAEGPHGSAQ